MEGFLFMLGTIVIEGGLISLLMWLFTAGDRETSRREAPQSGLEDLRMKSKAA